MTAMRWVGYFELFTQYKTGDVVYYELDGFTYICMRDNPETLPNERYPLDWQVVSSFVSPNSITLIDGGVF